MAACQGQGTCPGTVLKAPDKALNALQQHFHGDCGQDQAHQAVQALGGAGFLADSAVSRLFRDAKLMEIGAGTSEIRRMLIGRELMAAPA